MKHSPVFNALLTIANLLILRLVVKLYTEFFKERAIAARK